MATKVGMGILLGLLAITVGCKDKKITTDKDKYSYTLGYRWAENLKNQKVDVDAEATMSGIRDALAGKPSGVNEADANQAMMKMYESRRAEMGKVAEENKKKGDEWLAANKQKEGVQVTASGLQYKVIKEGDGAKPKPTNTVKVHYKGTLIDGTEFDSSYKRNEPAEFPVQGVIQGWIEGLQLMKKGAKYEFYIPADLAYKEQGQPGIPPNSVLVFEVELLEITK